MKFGHRISALLAVGLLACGGGTSTKGTGPGTGGSADGNNAGETTAPVAEEYRKSQPKPSAPRPFQLPPIQTFKLGNAIDVYLVENHDLPTVSVSLVLDGGAMSDPKGKEGLASACMDMLTEGTKKLDKLAFQRALADIGSDVWSWASVDTQGLGMRTLSKNFDQTMKLFVDSLRTPGFRKSDLNRMVKRRIASIKQSKGNPSAVAGRVMWSVTYGATHPNGRVSTEKSLSRLRTSDCKRYHARYLKPTSARMFVVGDLKEKQVREAFEPLLKKWRGKPAVSKMPTRQPRKGRLFFVDIPGSQQSAV